MQHFLKSCLVTVTDGFQSWYTSIGVTDDSRSPSIKCKEQSKLQCTGTHHKSQQLFPTRFFVSLSMIAINSPNMMRMHNQCQQSNFQPTKVFFLLNKGIFEYLKVWLWLEALLCPFKSQRRHHQFTLFGPEPLPSTALMPLDETIRYPHLVWSHE